MQDALVLFGWCAVVFFLAAVLIPYLRGRGELMSSWSLFLVGAANFIGYDAVLSGNRVFNWGLFTNQDYLKLIAGVIVYTIAVFIGYYAFKFPGRLAGRTFLKWPDYRGSAGYAIIAVCVTMLFFSVFFPEIQFIGQIIIILGPPAGVLAICIAFKRWWDNRISAGLLVLLAALLIISLVAAMHGTTGRRNVLSVVLAIPTCVYFLWLRYRRLGWSIIPLSVLVAATVIVMGAYTSIRHRYNAEKVNVADRSPLQTAIESLRMLPGAIIQLRGLDNILGSGAIEASLVAIAWYPQSAPHEPFFTIRYILANPIPRAWWPEKPKALGETLPRDTGQWSRGYVNWGPGVVGHGFHEGGYHFIVFYAILAGIAMRYFDELLKRQPDNPYLMGMLAGASGQIVAYTRGDIGLFTVLIIGAVLAILVVRWVMRPIVGYTLVYPSDAERLQLQQMQQSVGFNGAEMMMPAWPASPVSARS